jgi:hypothetical protein
MWREPFFRDQGIRLQHHRAIDTEAMNNWAIQTGDDQGDDRQEPKPARRRGLLFLSSPEAGDQRAII